MRETSLWFASTREENLEIAAAGEVPGACGDHGRVLDEESLCEDGPEGDFCDTRSGFCLHGRAEKGGCVCNDMWHGEDCSHILCHKGKPDENETRFLVLRTGIGEDVSVSPLSMAAATATSAPTLGLRVGLSFRFLLTDFPSCGRKLHCLKGRWNPDRWAPGEGHFRLVCDCEEGFDGELCDRCMLEEALGERREGDFPHCRSSSQERRNSTTSTTKFSPIFPRLACLAISALVILF